MPSSSAQMARYFHGSQRVDLRSEFAVGDGMADRLDIYAARYGLANRKVSRSLERQQRARDGAAALSMYRENLAASGDTANRQRHRHRPTSAGSAINAVAGGKRARQRDTRGVGGRRRRPASAQARSMSSQPERVDFSAIKRVLRGTSSDHAGTLASQPRGRRQRPASAHARTAASRDAAVDVDALAARAAAGLAAASAARLPEPTDTARESKTSREPAGDVERQRGAQDGDGVTMPTLPAGDGDGKRDEHSEVEEATTHPARRKVVPKRRRRKKAAAASSNGSPGARSSAPRRTRKSRPPQRGSWLREPLDGLPRPKYRRPKPAALTVPVTPSVLKHPKRADSDQDKGEPRVSDGIDSGWSTDEQERGRSRIPRQRQNGPGSRPRAGSRRNLSAGSRRSRNRRNRPSSAPHFGRELSHPTRVSDTEEFREFVRQRANQRRSASPRERPRRPSRHSQRRRARRVTGKRVSAADGVAMEERKEYRPPRPHHRPTVKLARPQSAHPVLSTPVAGEGSEAAESTTVVGETAPSRGDNVSDAEACGPPAELADAASGVKSDILAAGDTGTPSRQSGRAGGDVDDGNGGDEDEYSSDDDFERKSAVGESADETYLADADFDPESPTRVPHSEGVTTVEGKELEAGLHAADTRPTEPGETAAEAPESQRCADMPLASSEPKRRGGTKATEHKVEPPSNTDINPSELQSPDNAREGKDSGTDEAGPSAAATRTETEVTVAVDHHGAAGNSETKEPNEISGGEDRAPQREEREVGVEDSEQKRELSPAGAHIASAADSQSNQDGGVRGSTQVHSPARMKEVAASAAPATVELDALPSSTAADAPFHVDESAVLHGSGDEAGLEIADDLEEISMEPAEATSYAGDASRSGVVAVRIDDNGARAGSPTGGAGGKRTSTRPANDGKSPVLGKGTFDLWKDIFTEPSPVRAYEIAVVGDKSAASGPPCDPTAQLLAFLHRYEAADERDRERWFVHAMTRLEQLWADAEVPVTDRELFRKCHGVHRNVGSGAAVAAHLQVMIEHQKLKADIDYHIREREELLSRYRREVAEYMASGHTEDDWGRQGSDMAVRARSVRHILLALVRQGIAVVEGVERWRATMWRNWPYDYRGMNILMKMRGDTDFIVQDVDSARMLADLRVPPDEFSYLSFALALRAAGPPRSKTAAKRASTEETRADRGGRPFPAMRARIASAALVVALEPQREAELQVECQQLAAQGLYVPRMRWRMGGHNIVPPSTKPTKVKGILGGANTKRKKKKARPAWQ